MTEQKAIQICLENRDPGGFEFLVRKYSRQAYSHSCGILGNEDDARDICQEAFHRAFRAITLLKKLENFYPWFYTILRNCCFNFLKKKKHQKAYIEDLAADRSSTVNNNTPFHQAAERELRKAVWDKLDRLDGEYREILVLKYIAGESYSSISALLGVPRGTVMSRLYKARNAFKNLYYEGAFNG